MMRKLLRNELRVGCEILEASEKLLGFFDPETVEIRNRMVSALFFNGDKPGALAILRRLLEAAEAELGPEHPETQTARRELAFSSIRAGEIDAALEIFLKKLEVNERTTDEDGVIKTLEELLRAGDILRASDDYLGAGRAYLVALKENRRLRGRDHAATQKIEKLIAEIEAENEAENIGVPEEENTEDVGDAEQFYRRVLATTTDPTDANSVGAAISLALLLKSKNKISEAEAIYLRLLDELACGLGPEESYGTLRLLNELLQSKESIAKAEAHYRTSMNNWGAGTPDFPSNLRCQINLATLLSSTGRAAEAAEMLRSYIQRKKVPEVILRYHIACIECLGGNLESAKQLISKQISERPHHRARALADPALSAIRDFVETCPHVPLISEDWR